MERKRLVKPYFDAEYYKDKPLAIYCCGGYPNIAKRTIETHHEGERGYDFARVAFIKDGKPEWSEDADLLTLEEREQVIRMCAAWKDDQERHYVINKQTKGILAVCIGKAEATKEAARLNEANGTDKYEAIAITDYRFY